MSRYEVSRAQRTLARGLVLAQFALVALLLLPATRHGEPVGRARRGAGITLVGAGAGLGVTGALALGPALTPSPLPAHSAELRTDGLYGRVRHPIYAGLGLAAAGRALATGAPRHGGAALALGALLLVKARYEERRLATRFATYARYAARTPRWAPARAGREGSHACGS